MPPWVGDDWRGARARERNATLFSRKREEDKRKGELELVVRGAECVFREG